MEKKKDKFQNITNNFHAESNCQVFNGDIYGAIFAMPGSNVTQQALTRPAENNMPPNDMPVNTNLTDDENPTFMIHCSVSDRSQAMMIHNKIKKLVKNQGVQTICSQLFEMANNNEIHLPPAKKAYDELVRMALPNGLGFKEKTFMKYYSEYRR